MYVGDHELDHEISGLLQDGGIGAERWIEMMLINKPLTHDNSSGLNEESRSYKCEEILTKLQTLLYELQLSSLVKANSLDICIHPA